MLLYAVSPKTQGYRLKSCIITQQPMRRPPSIMLGTELRCLKKNALSTLLAIQHTKGKELIPIKKMPPTRIVRYCCDILKEQAGRGRFLVTGVRWSESTSRKNNRGVLEVQHKSKERRLTLANDNDESRRLFETCQMKGKRICNPIVDWIEQDIWDYLVDQKVQINPLYYEGWTRVGCVGCPMAGKARYPEFSMFPKYQGLYISAFDRMIKVRNDEGLQTEWQTGTDVFHWWMEDGVLPGQIEMEAY